MIKQSPPWMRMMLKRGARFIAALAVMTIAASVNCNAADTVCAVVTNRADFDHKSVTLQGAANMVRETTSRRGNDYTTFKLQDGGCEVSVFTWGHPTLKNGDHVCVDGVFKTEHHEGRYTFYNEIEAAKVNSARNKRSFD